MEQGLTAGSTITGSQKSSHPEEYGTVVAVGFKKALILWSDESLTRETHDDVVKQTDTAGLGGLTLMHYADGFDL